MLRKSCHEETYFTLAATFKVSSFINTDFIISITFGPLHHEFMTPVA